MKRSLVIIAVCIISLLGVGVYAASNNASASQPPAAVKAPEKQNTSLSGRVVETMDSGGYTYVSIEKNGKKTWVAIPKTRIKVGQDVTFIPGAEMKNFPSKGLKRTFDSIIFSAGLMPAEGVAAPSSESGNPHGGDKVVAADVKVEKAKGQNAYTIGEIYENMTKLHKKKVVVKAKVIKVSESIMGRNWIHLQDGTGNASKGTNKLISTSQDRPAVGDIITIKGTIYKDKDFGAGYKYKVIMEEASIQH